MSALDASPYSPATRLRARDEGREFGDEPADPLLDRDLYPSEMTYLVLAARPARTQLVATHGRKVSAESSVKLEHGVILTDPGLAEQRNGSGGVTPVGGIPGEVGQGRPETGVDPHGVLEIELSGESITRRLVMTGTQHQRRGHLAPTRGGQRRGELTDRW